jgi:hypothetical protein
VTSTPLYKSNVPFLFSLALTELLDIETPISSRVPVNISLVLQHETLRTEDRMGRVCSFNKFLPISVSLWDYFSQRMNADNIKLIRMLPFIYY